MHLAAAELQLRGRRQLAAAGRQQGAEDGWLQRPAGGCSPRKVAVQLQAAGLVRGCSDGRQTLNLQPRSQETAWIACEQQYAPAIRKMDFRDGEVCGVDAVPRGACEQHGRGASVALLMHGLSIARHAAGRRTLTLTVTLSRA